MVDSCAMCRSGATRGRLELPAEALNLMIGESEFDVDKVSGPIHISFCEDYWAECRDLVLDHDINPVIRCFADEVYYTDAEDKWGEKHGERKETELIGQARRAAQDGWYSEFGMDEVASKIILWTLDALFDVIASSTPLVDRSELLAEDPQSSAEST